MIWPHVTAPSCSRDAWLPPETPGRAAAVTQNAPGGPGGSLGVAPVVSLRKEGGGVVVRGKSLRPDARCKECYLLTLVEKNYFHWSSVLSLCEGFHVRSLITAVRD